MRRDKTFTRILLIFSIANVVLAAPAVVIQRSPVTDGQESTEGSVSSIVPDSDASQSLAGLGGVSQAPPPSQAGAEHESPAGSVHKNFVPESSGLGAQQLNDPPTTPGAEQLHDDSPSGPGAQSPHEEDTHLWQNWYSVTVPESSGSGAQQLNGPPTTPGAPPSHGDSLPASGAEQLHGSDDSPSGSGAQSPHEDTHLWQNWHPVTEIEEAPSSRLQSSHLEPETLEAPRISGGSLGSGWSEAFAAAAEAEAKEAEAAAKEADDKVKPKGLCGLRCWMQFYF